MNFSNEARGKLTEARNVLIKRRNETENAADRDKIDEAIDEINDNVGLLNQAELLEAADAVVDSTVALERLVRSARLGPFDDYVKQLEKVLNGISGLLRNGELTEHLERAPVASPAPEKTTPAAPTAVATEPKPTPPPVLAPGPTGVTSPPVSGPTLPAITSSTDFAALATEYRAWFEAMAARQEYKEKVDWHTKMLLKYQPRYREVSRTLNNNVPWSMIGVIHAMECGFNFTCHLHNGDPLTARTRHVPAGKPKDGEPPFAWEKSVADALTGEGFTGVTDWSMPHMLYLLEKYNGFGYRTMGRPTPYLWSFSNRYEKGKYVADRTFDPEAVSKQCGAAVMLKSLSDQGVSLV